VSPELQLFLLSSFIEVRAMTLTTMFYDLDAE